MEFSLKELWSAVIKHFDKEFLKDLDALSYSNFESSLITMNLLF